MASSTLSSRVHGRVLSIKPESPVDGDHGGPLIADRDESPESLNHISDQGMLSFSRYGLSDFPAYNRTSEALDFWRPFPEIPGLPTRGWEYHVGKRVFDLLLAALLLPVIAPVVCLIGCVIALTSGLPVFYRHNRIGRGGREFSIWKFRTMYVHSDRILRDHLKRNPAARTEWQNTQKLRNDPRITPFGQFLRKTSLDELPQILNVLAGDMSFVGPRPIIEAETHKYAERFAYYLSALPGITGLWQVSGRSTLSYDARVILDETYVRKWSLWRDIWILLKTPSVVCGRDGAY